MGRMTYSSPPLPGSGLRSVLCTDTLDNSIFILASMAMLTPIKVVRKEEKSRGGPGVKSREPRFMHAQKKKKKYKIRNKIDIGKVRGKVKKRVARFLSMWKNRDVSTTIYKTC